MRLQESEDCKIQQTDPVDIETCDSGASPS